MHSYALLVPAGLEQVACSSLPPQRHGSSEGARHLCIPPPVATPPGTSLGAAGAVSPIMATTEEGPIGDNVLASPCLAAALALVFHSNLETHQLASASTISGALLKGSSSTWAAALTTWAAHQGMSAQDGPAAHPVTYRVATLRFGDHTFTSRDLDGEVGSAISKLQPAWSVSLDAPHLLFICLLVRHRITIGLLLPPFEPRRSDVLPLEPRLWLRAGRDRPHTRPSRAANLVRLAALQPNERLLDPCGGIGVLCIEAATSAAVHAISLDLDAAACAAATCNAAAAASGHALVAGAQVCVVHGDCTRTPLQGGSVDVVIADLPFGLRHARLDIGALMRELARLVPAGGRAIILGSAGPGGSATACAKVVRTQQPHATWLLRGETPCYSGGVPCDVLRFERLSSPTSEGSGTRRRGKRPLDPHATRPQGEQQSHSPPSVQMAVD